MSVLAAPQGLGSLASAGDGQLHLVWTGGQSNVTTQPDIAHQLRYARIQVDSFGVVDQVEPFTLSGFEHAYPGPYSQQTLWQEHPATAVTTDGALHVVWEARDGRPPRTLGSARLVWCVCDHARTRTTSGRIRSSDRR